MTSDTTLVIIDMQRIFRDPASQWCCPDYDSAADNIRKLVAHQRQAGGLIVWTRFVRAPDEQGVWKAYYDHWDQCRLPADAPDWNLTLDANADDRVLTRPTFSKWGTELANLAASTDTVTVCGVATDCCVLSTVLGAVDAGCRVILPIDACAGASREAHDEAAALMAMLAPMVVTCPTDSITAP